MDGPAPTTEAVSANVPAPDDRPVPDDATAPAELVLARRMHALGFLADGVAHDIANPLGAILALRRRSSPRTSASPPTCGPIARLLRDEADRTYRMVSALLELARTRPLADRPIAMEPVVRTMLELAAYPLAGVDVELDVPCRPARRARRPIGGAPVASRRRWSTRSRPWVGPTPAGACAVSGSTVADRRDRHAQDPEAGGRDGRREPVA